jgi:hypothetical protein
MRHLFAAMSKTGQGPTQNPFAQGSSGLILKVITSLHLMRGASPQLLTILTAQRQLPEDYTMLSMLQLA